MLLSEMLKTNNTLKTLWLDNNNVTETNNSLNGKGKRNLNTLNADGTLTLIRPPPNSLGELPPGASSSQVLQL